MVPNDENVAVGRCSPFRTAAPDGDAVNAVDEAPLWIAVVKADVGVWLRTQCFLVKKPLTPVFCKFPVFLILFTTLLHLVPFLFQYEVQYLYVDYFGHTSVLHFDFLIFFQHTMVAVIHAPPTAFGVLYEPSCRCYLRVVVH